MSAETHVIVLPLIELARYRRELFRLAEYHHKLSLEYLAGKLDILSGVHAGRRNGLQDAAALFERSLMRSSETVQ